MCRVVEGRWMLVLGVGMAIASAAPAPGADRSAEQILREIDALKAPQLDAKKRQDPAYVREFRAQLQVVSDQRNKLILELYKTAPDHQRLPELMGQRWMTLVFRPEPVGNDGLIRELDDVLAHAKNRNLKVEAAYSKARFKLLQSRSSGSLDLSAVEEFLKLAPKDPRAPRLVYMAATATRDPATQALLEDRVLKDFPTSPEAGRIKGIHRRNESTGKPFDLEFTDAIKGTTVSIKGLKGKVVVIDFWATWCGPCVAEMPKMKQLYAKYHDQGVEFIGVSLDVPQAQGGLDRLKKFVKENEIPWPQYYQGNYWQSEFSSSWGINAIPAVFVVDQEGKLYSVEARGKLETIIPELLKKKAGAAAAGGE